jgi:hypothetical protein
LALAAACLFAVRHVRTLRSGYLVLALAALGIAVQMKQSFLRSCLALGVVLVVSALWRAPRKPALRALALGALLAGLMIGPWMLRSLELYGLPLSPLPVTLLSVTLGQAPPELQWYLARPTLERGWDAELRTLATLFGDLGQGREVPTLLALLPLALLPLGLARGLRKRTAALLLLAPALVADLVTFGSQELAPVRLRYMHTSARFLLFALVLAVVLSALAPRTRAGARVYAHYLRGAGLLLLVLYASVGWSELGALVAGAASSVLAGLAALARVLLRRPARLAAPALALALLSTLVALDATRSALRYPLFRGDFAVHALPTFWVDAAQALDDPAHPRRIAVTGGAHQDMDRWFSYAFLGRRLQNELVYVTPQLDGSVRHFGLDPLLEVFDRGVDAAAWLRALRRARITHVVTFDPPSIELAIIRANPQRFVRVSSARFEAFGVFELLPVRRPHPSGTRGP